MFNELQTEGMEESQDRLGGFQLLESGAYDGEIKLAYVTDSAKSAAKCVVTVIQYPDHEMTERVWVTSGKGDPYYMRGDKKIPLPGFDLINSMCLLATGHPLSDQDIEDKTIKIWDKEAGKEIDKSMPVITTLLGKKISAGVLKQIVNKQEQGSDGKWFDTNDKREENVTDKYFHFESKRTVAEVKSKLELADDDLFYAKWSNKNTGVVRNRFKEVTGGSAGSSGTGSPAGGAKKSGSLFQ